VRFGSVDTFLDLGDWAFRMGRPVANQGFLRALLVHGTWDAYHFFAPDTAQASLFSSKVAELVPQPELQRRIFVSPHAHLPSLLAEKDWNVFHQGDFTYFTPHLAALRSRVAKRPFPITGVTHSLDGALMQLRFLQLVLAGMAPWDAIVCTSRAAARLVAGKLDEVRGLLRAATGAELACPARTPRIPLGIEDALFDGPDRAEARRHLHIPEGAVVGLSVGRLSLRTKTDWSPILEELGRMRAAGQLGKFILLIAGGGQNDGVKLLQGLIDGAGLTNQVFLFPNFTPETKPHLYRAADFYLSLVDTNQETFGLSVIEAMAAGLPVVASDFDGYRDAVVDGENGFLVPTIGTTALPDFMAPNLGILDANLARLYLAQMVAVDLPPLRAALRTLIDDVALRQRMGEEARRRAEGYRWARVIAEYEALWRSLDEEAARGTPPLDPATAASRAALLAGDGVRAFAHFPSRALGPGDRVALTDVGRRLHDEPARATRYDDVACVTSLDLERALLAAVAREARRVDELHALGAERFAASPGDVEFQLLWLLKHGALTLV
jgi:glycosyltransferase involved in cell wall biosynthesis